MKMKTNLKIDDDLQPPFLDEDLLPLDFFIQFCHGQGLTLDKDELAQYEKEQLIYPAVRVRREYSKTYSQFTDYPTSKKFVWHYDRVHPHPFRSPNWLKKFRQKRIVIRPTKHEFMPWEKYDQYKIFEIKPTTKQLRHNLETYYARHQLFPIRFVKNAKIFLAGLIPPQISPVEQVELRQFLGKKRKNQHITNSIQDRIAEYHKLVKLLIEIQGLQNQEAKTYNSAYKEALAGHGGNQSAANKDLDHSDAWKVNKRGVLEIFNKHQISLRDLEIWRLLLLTYGPYRITADNYEEQLEILTKHVKEFDLLDYQYPYQIVHYLNWFMERCGGKPTAMHDLFARFTKWKSCVYCREYFRPSKPNQVTCGKKKCKQYLSKTWKQSMRN
ncbi:MAG: hypothetical protein Q8P73_04120 [bacterium]|nr:hypothetical protein [bacterium]